MQKNLLKKKWLIFENVKRINNLQEVIEDDFFATSKIASENQLQKS